MTAIETKTLKVGRYVDTAHVDTLIRNYKQERWVHNSERIGKEDSLSVWYSVEELEEFMTRIKDSGGDGVKFYFAAYPSDYNLKPEYAGRQTIVMVATKQKLAEDGVSNKDIYITTEKGNNIVAYNSGQMCPPYCGPSTKKPGDDPDWGGLGVTIVDRGAKGWTVV